MESSKQRRDDVKSVKSITASFCNLTTIGAIHKFTDTPSRFLFKIIYAVATFLSALLVCRTLWVSTAQFFENEVDTVVSTVNILSKIQFPTVTVCILQICGFSDYEFNKYLDIYKKNEREKFNENKDEEIENKLRKNLTKTSFFLAREVFLREYNDSELVRILTRNRTSISYASYQQLVRCSLSGKKCDEQDFEYFSVGEFQKCYKFNSGFHFNGTKRPIDLVDKFGENEGFQLEMYIGNQSECKSPLSTTSGISVYVHNSTYTLTEEDNAILVEPGTKSSIGIDRTFVKQLPNPYSDCIQDINSKTLARSDLIRKTHNLSGIYTQQYCLQLCFEEFLVQFCNCFDNSLPNFQPQGYESCSKFIDSIYNCEYLVKRLFYNGKNDQHCLKACPRECEYISYETTSYSSEYPSKGYKQILDTVMDKEVNPEGMVAVNVFYKESKLKEIVEEPALTGEIYVSQLGGAIGLFLGCSILSLVEILEVLLELLVLGIISVI